MEGGSEGEGEILGWREGGREGEGEILGWRAGGRRRVEKRDDMEEGYIYREREERWKMRRRRRKEGEKK